MSASVPWRQSPGAPIANANTAPAFTAVHARRTFARPELTTPTPSPQPQPTTKKVQWPQSVRDYVQRCFASDAAIPGIERRDVEQKLKKIITEATEDDMLYSISWETHPLPQQIIQAERAESAGLNKAPWRKTSTPEKNMMSDGNRKRKSPDSSMTDADGDSLPPWRKANKRKIEEATTPVRSLAERMDKRHHISPQVPEDGSSKYQMDLERRRQRFENGKSGPKSPWNSSRDDSPADANDGPVVGTCQDLEKRYLRLTAAPKPEAVRPLSVLEKTLEFLKKKWRKENNYSYICDQFKSLRQDLTVQHIKTEFTVTVYEIHARIALEQGDMGEYNQCQTQLRALYAQKLGGHPAEFLAYRILYFIYTQNRTGMNEVLADLTPADKTQPAVKHALDVRSALALGNYHRFFRLYLDTPNMGAYLMDMFVGRERLLALANICKAYKPCVKVRFLTEELGFESDSDCVQFLLSQHDDLSRHLEQKDEGLVLFHAPKAYVFFESAKTAAFGRIDIKGQK
ncbi:uncharacterized protein K452DRAFT_295783 [Aplosporella prunicola CBS 121167]|uniref:PCI domain-containing protein n=1 Tax=Aplosporella prunicola CBS 121167 TaxID=1176127 RepID=A0A6A6BMI2_9PEZI|nr:uncharacterized protein K452DRAFT_295783 [Aplosporella prunicola CBS 121167]KAF2145266.1 hypothetical protein K452DRAFT_295783 [Aplosporella prunicola CBS 121167]